MQWRGGLRGRLCRPMTRLLVWDVILSQLQKSNGARSAPNLPEHLGNSSHFFSADMISSVFGSVPARDGDA